jgi:murein DD-endopeptidase MepM/ murein hydrolase activator NlpD
MPNEKLAPYRWPVGPFDRMHPVRGYLNDPRDGKLRSSFHFGIDISAPDGTPVHAVEAGTVYLEGAQNVAVMTADEARTFGYWHLKRVVEHHQSVRKGQILGTIGKGFAHVHFAERAGGQYVNPLRSGALTPFVDAGSPRVQRIVCERSGKELDPAKLRGAVDVVVEAYDRPPLPVPPPWADMPVAPSLIRWRIVAANGAVARPWHTPVDLRARMLPQELFTTIYAPGSRQNHPNQPGLYRYFLAHTWSTRLLANGAYRIDVEVSDLHGNKALARLPIRIANPRSRTTPA